MKLTYAEVVALTKKSRYALNWADVVAMQSAVGVILDHAERLGKALDLGLMPAGPGRGAQEAARDIWLAFKRTA